MDTPIALTQSLSKRMGNTAVIRELDFSLAPGATAVILGESASGKSVFLKLLSGLLPPTGGKAEIAGGAPSDPATRAVVAYQAQTPSLPGHMTIPELVRLYTHLFADFDGERATALFTELRVKTDKQIRKFSKSTRVKIAVILTMCRRARLYLLDEPITGDDTAKEYLLRVILENRAEGSALLIATKDASRLKEHADQLYVLEDGKLIPAGIGGSRTC